MSLLDTSNSKCDIIKLKYSLSEVEKSDYTATFFDSFHKSKVITPYINIKNNLDTKTNNFFLALKSITTRNIEDDTFQKLLISEFSETFSNKNDKNIPQTHIHILTENIIKNTNNLIKLNLKSKNDNIIYKNLNATNNIFKFQTEPNLYNDSLEDEDTIIYNSNSSINDNKSKISNLSNQIHSTTITKKNKQNNFLAEPVSKQKYFNSILTEQNLEVINDLEEPYDIKLKDYEIKTNILKKNKKSIDNNCFKKIYLNNSTNKKKHSKKFSCVEFVKNNIIYNNTKTTTARKLRKKFERSEFKKNTFNTAQAGRQEKNEGFLENKNINTNLMDKFNYCTNKKNNINETSNNKFESINEKNDEPGFDFFNCRNDNNNIIITSIISDNNCENCSNYEQNRKISNLLNSINNSKSQLFNNNEIINEINIETDNNFQINKIQSQKLIFYDSAKKNSEEFFENSNLKNINESNKNKNYSPKSPIKIRQFDLLPPFKNIKKNYKSNFNIKNNKHEKKIFNSSSINKKKKPKNYFKKMYQKYNNDLSNEDLYLESDNDYTNNYSSVYDMSFYNNLLEINNSYKKINTETIFKKHPIITWEIRLNSLLWIMITCEDFAYKRDTFHYSCFYFDLYLTLTKEIIKDKKKLNLIGIACISISAKLEEIQIPKLEEYVESIDDCFDKNDIIIMEQKICKCLGWKLIPMTLSTWINWYICQWDLFYDSIDDIKNYLLNFIDDENIIYYKKQCEDSYYNFRKIYQLIDLIVLDYNSYNYDMRYLIAASFFCCLCICNNMDYDFKQKKLQVKNCLDPLNKKITKALLDTYMIFIEKSFAFSFYDDELQDTINYVYKFRNYKFSYDIPLIFQLKQHKLEECTYEDFLSYQTTDDNIFTYFKNLYKSNTNTNKNYRNSLKSFH